MFDFSETEAFLDDGEQTPRFSEAGYETSNFVELLGPIFLAVLAWIAYLIIIALLRVLFSPCGLNFFTRRLREPIVFGVVIIRFLLEGCLEIGISAAIQVLSLKKDIFNKIDDVIAFLLAILAIVGLAIAPVYFCIIT